MGPTLYRVLLKPIHSNGIMPAIFNVDSMTLTELYVKSEDQTIFKVVLVKTIFKQIKKTDAKTTVSTLHKFLDKLKNQNHAN